MQLDFDVKPTFKLIIATCKLHVDAILLLRVYPCTKPHALPVSSDRQTDGQKAMHTGLKRLLQDKKGFKLTGSDYTEAAVI